MLCTGHVTNPAGRLFTPETLANTAALPGVFAVATSEPVEFQVSGPTPEVMSVVPLNTVAVNGCVWPCDLQSTDAGLTTIRSTLEWTNTVVFAVKEPLEAVISAVPGAPAAQFTFAASQVPAQTFVTQAPLALAAGVSVTAGLL